MECLGDCFAWKRESPFGKFYVSLRRPSNILSKAKINNYVFSSKPYDFADSLICGKLISSHSQ